MKGIQFVIDGQGEKTAVVIDLKKHRNLWEDFYDHAVAKSYDSAQLNLGIILANPPGARRDEARAVRLYRSAAHQGNRNAA